MAKMVAAVVRYSMGGKVGLTFVASRVLEEIRSVAPHLPRLASLDHRSAEMLVGIEGALKRFVDLDCTYDVEKSTLESELDRCVDAVRSPRLRLWVPNAPAELDFWMR